MSTRVDRRGTDDPTAVASTLKAFHDAAVPEFRIVSSWDDVQFVLRGKDFDVDDESYIVGKTSRSSFLGDAVGHIRGRPHFERRRILAALFSSARLAALEQEQLEPAVIRALEAAAHTKRRRDGLVEADLVDLCTDMMLDLMAAVVGLDGIAESTEARARLRSYFNDLDAGVRAKFATGDLDEVVSRGLAARRRFVDEFFRPAWERRAQLLADGDELPVDLISLILQHRDHFDQFMDDVAEHEATLFLIGSVGSTTTAVCLAIDDLEGWLPNHPEDDPQEDGFLVRAIAESLRYNSRIFTNRVAVNDTVLPSGQAVKAGELIWVNMRSADRDRFGEDADQFNPNRVQPEGKGDPSGLAFGDGRHTCIAKWMILGESGNERQGTVRLMLEHLIKAGVRSVPGKPVVKRESVRVAVESMPVVFTNLP